MVMYFSVLETESDRDVFQKLYRENRQKLYAIARKRLPSEADAEDAVHTCFLKMAERFADYRHQPYKNLERIACIIVCNAATDIWRKYQNNATLTDEADFCEDIPDVSQDVLEQVMEKFTQSLVAQALMELTKEERDLLNLQYGMGLKPKTIGKMLEVSSGTVRKKTLRCRNKLAKILEDKGYESVR